MKNLKDGPKSDLFKPLNIKGNYKLNDLSNSEMSNAMLENAKFAIEGSNVCWGVPFEVDKVHIIKERSVNINIDMSINSLIFMHTMERNNVGDGYEDPRMVAPINKKGRIGDVVAKYIVLFEDDSEHVIDIKSRHQIGLFQRGWGENCFEAVANIKPNAVSCNHIKIEDNDIGLMRNPWSQRQRRTEIHDMGEWVNWLYAWKNPFPNKKIKEIKIEPLGGTIVLSAISAGNITTNPFRWESRKKAMLTLPKDIQPPKIDSSPEFWKYIQMDLGQIVSVSSRVDYGNKNWETNLKSNILPVSENEVIVEYTSHSDAVFYLENGNKIPVSTLKEKDSKITVIPESKIKVNVKVVDKGTKKIVPVKLHIHGEFGEYIAPIDRHRIPNGGWFEDYAPENTSPYFSTYIDGETTVKLPQCKVYIEITKGFEIKPIRKVLEIDESCSEILFEIESVLPWRANNWISADTHVHFLSPATAHLEGAGEGVNVVNLLASQWGELFTNVGDFDGKTVHGTKESGGDGEHLVRVGTENRQHVLGHISLLGYEGNMINPLCSGGPAESAIGDPLEILLTEWAEKCNKQNGLTIIPHFPNPKCENAAVIVNNLADGVEMSGHCGISPYSLLDLYRYFNLGYQVPIVGGTDKMGNGVTVGQVRTYAKLDNNTEFSYETWKDAIKNGNTFVTFGPLLEFSVDGKSAGSRIAMSANGGTVDINWKCASVTFPMSKIELLVGGEVLESIEIDKNNAEGTFSAKIAKSTWVALLIRGYNGYGTEEILAHTSTVMIDLKGTHHFSEIDAVTILEQIEGAIAYLDVIGTKADEKRYKEMRMKLTSTYRQFHNQMHQNGHFHDHSVITNHKEHNN